VIYCDTSLLVSIVSSEVHSELARSWYYGIGPICVISDWSRTEVASAIARKHRNGVIDDGYRSAAERAWIALQAETSLVAVTPDHFTQATVLVDSLPRGLRAGDALHLAITLDHGCDLATLDRDLADAARALGVAVHPATP
jgi:predicted nucleic acid-binding protein